MSKHIWLAERERERRQREREREREREGERDGEREIRTEERGKEGFRLSFFLFLNVERRRVFKGDKVVREREK